MATNPAAAADPAAFENYYWGLRGNPRLLARSSTQPWIPPMTEEIGYSGQREQVRKVISVVRRHILRERLEHGLRHKILQVLATMNPCRWISVDYIRLGYDRLVEKNNPVVVWVTVEENQVTEVEAQRIVNALTQVCRRADLPDVEVEMTEGRRATNNEVPARGQPMPMPTEYPHIGASIGLDSSTIVGTLGGYVQIDGEIMGITNHHVAFGPYRIEAFPSADEESSGKMYTFLQPADADLQKRIEVCETEIRHYTERQSTMGYSSSDAEDIKKLQSEVEKLKSWTPERSILGTVWKTSGLRARKAEIERRFRLDWALIKLVNPERFQDPKNFVNKGPAREFHVSPFYVALGMKAAGQTKVNVPGYLKRSLAYDEVQNLQDCAEEEDRKYVVWKFGRSTHYTFGDLGDILSNYKSESGFVSDEQLVIDHDFLETGRTFSALGDSGSLVWDSDGYVCAMLWGGKAGSHVHYVTPFEYVLEDIRQVCNAKEVKLVVRKEDETDVVFGPPERKKGGLKLGVDNLAEGFEVADMLGAESEREPTKGEIT